MAKSSLAKMTGKQILITLATILTSAVLTLFVYGAKSWADNTYVSQTQFLSERVEDKIETIDIELFKLSLRLGRATDPREVTDIKSLQEYYERLREHHLRKLEEKG